MGYVYNFGDRLNPKADIIPLILQEFFIDKKNPVFPVTKTKRVLLPRLKILIKHTTYSRNNMGQKCEGNCGLWVLNEIILKKYIPTNLKKNVGAVWESSAKKTFQ